MGANYYGTFSKYTAVEDSEVNCYNTEGDRNSIVSQASCRMG
jgi:hypothetical protein